MTASQPAAHRLETTFAACLRRARRLSLLGSLAGHSMLLALMFAAGAARLLATIPLTAAPPRPASAAAEARHIELVDPPLPAADPAGPTGIDPELYKRLLTLGVRDAGRLTPQQAEAKLAELAKQADGISDTSLAEIGHFLGSDPSKYRVRNYYLEELNPNIGFHSAKVVRAFRFTSATGDAGYTITLEDREQDSFTFSLRDRAAADLEAGGVLFAGRPLLDSAERPAGAFELQGARITDIQRWKRTDRSGSQGVIASFSDVQGRERKVRIPSSAGSPLVLGQIAFARNPDGSFIFDPESDETVFTQLVDLGSASLWRATPAESRAPGVTRARVVLIDREGNRMITYKEGGDAEDILSRFGLIENNPALRRIYEGAGCAELLLKLFLSTQQAPAPTPAPAPAHVLPPEKEPR